MLNIAAADTEGGASGMKDCMYGMDIDVGTADCSTTVETEANDRLSGLYTDLGADCISSQITDSSTDCISGEMRDMGTGCISEEGTVS